METNKQKENRIIQYLTEYFSDGGFDDSSYGDVIPELDHDEEDSKSDHYSNSLIDTHADPVIFLKVVEHCLKTARQKECWSKVWWNQWTSLQT